MGQILAIWFLFVCISAAVVCVYSLIRNNWVLEQRITLIENDYQAYGKLPSYNAMLYGHGFWRWDIEYFIKLGDGK